MRLSNGDFTMRVKTLINEAEVKAMFVDGMTLQYGDPDLLLDAYVADGKVYHCMCDVVMCNFDLYVVGDEPLITELMPFETAGREFSNGYRSLCQTLWGFDRPAYAREGKLYVNPPDLQYIYEQYSERLSDHIVRS